MFTLQDRQLMNPDWRSSNGEINMTAGELHIRKSKGVPRAGGIQLNADNEFWFTKWHAFER